LFYRLADGDTQAEPKFRRVGALSQPAELLRMESKLPPSKRPHLNRSESHSSRFSTPYGHRDRAPERPADRGRNRRLPVEIAPRTDDCVIDPHPRKSRPPLHCLHLRCPAGSTCLQPIAPTVTSMVFSPVSSTA